MSGLSFDRAADYYDRTRGLPERVRDEVTAVLAGALADRGRVLEIGVGTGRIALPLHALGVPLAGVDLSAPMLRRLVANAGGVPPFPLAVADATRLPFAAGRFGAVLASHVLHLIPDWELAVREAGRVLRPGGVLLVDFGGGVPAPWAEPTGEILARHGIRQLRPGISDPKRLADATGLAMRPLPAVRFTLTRTLGRDLQDWSEQLFAWLWSYEPAQVAAAVADVRRWAGETGVSLSEPVTLERTVQWWELAGLA